MRQEAHPGQVAPLLYETRSESDPIATAAAGAVRKLELQGSEMATHKLRRLLMASEVRQRFRISDKTLRSCLRDLGLGFPQPRVFDQRCWYEDEIVAFEAHLEAMRRPVQRASF